MQKMGLLQKYVILMRKSNSNRCRNDKFVDSFIGFPELSKRLLAEQKKANPFFITDGLAVDHQ